MSPDLLHQHIANLLPARAQIPTAVLFPAATALVRHIEATRLRQEAVRHQARAAQATSAVQHQAIMEVRTPAITEVQLLAAVTDSAEAPQVVV